MKKIIFLFSSLILAGTMLTSCGSTVECPAYGQVESNVDMTEMA